MVAYAWNLYLINGSKPLAFATSEGQADNFFEFMTISVNNFTTD